MAPPSLTSSRYLQSNRDTGIRKQIIANISSLSIKKELSVWLLAHETKRNHTEKQNKLITEPKKL